MISLDTETTGVDLWHGCLPYMVQTCRDDGLLRWWEFDIDPFTRLPVINPTDLDEILDVLCEDELVLHNSKFDLRALDALFKYAQETIGYQYEPDWQWEFIEDSCVASHALRNLWSHSLKFLREVFLYVSERKQKALRDATNRGRQICRTNAFKEEYGEWRTASPRDPHWPAIERAPSEPEEDIEGWWLLDTWLPKAIHTHTPHLLPEIYSSSTNKHSSNEHISDNISEHNSNEYDSDEVEHPWKTIALEYGLEDVETTLPLYDLLKNALQDENLWDQYQTRKRLIEVTYQMESHGVPIKSNIEQTISKYQRELEFHVNAAKDVINKPDLNLNSGKQMQELLYNEFQLPVIKKTKPSKTFPQGQPATDADTIEKLANEVPEGSNIHVFFQNLAVSRKNEKSITYLTSYRDWSLDFRVHSSTNITGTKFTRQSMSNPNLQNVGTGEEGEGNKTEYNLREVFGPRPGRVWFDPDYSNIELRIWGYECGNKEFIECFKTGESVHLLIAYELHPRLRSLSPREVKETTSYKKTKNGDFSIIYGATEKRADATYGVKGAYRNLINRFPEVKSFTSYLHKQVKKDGYIETMTGYRLYIPLEDPHKAVSGFVQGTAGSVIGEAMIACHDYLQEHPEADIQMILQVHDELLFDGPDTPETYSHFEKLLRIMESIGNKINIPLPVGDKVIRYPNTWDKGEALVPF